ncbi:MAG: DUF3324 domain-containing protein, partial [Lachnospiraceae bacterium]|nr:DUF3324 domain-containing protein [Lachnospiraceae bacterium]
QVDYMGFYLTKASISGDQTFVTYIPKEGVNLESSSKVNAGGISTSIKGSKSIFKDASNKSSYRKDSSQTTVLTQGFTVKDTSDAPKTVTVVPRAGATKPKSSEVLESKLSNDKGHAIKIIPDGVSPTIMGDDILKNLDSGTGVSHEELGVVEITAIDNQSGLKNLSVSIENVDAHSVREYTMDPEKKISIDFTSDPVFFEGELHITIRAVDNVGNINTKTYGADILKLTADIEPNTLPRGGEGTLHIVTYGYAERVTIGFPEELKAINEGLKKDYNYAYPEFIKEEGIDFMIPYNKEEIPPGTYTFTITAYKNGKTVVAHPSVTVIDDTALKARVRLR